MIRPAFTLCLIAVALVFLWGCRTSTPGPGKTKTPAAREVPELSKELSKGVNRIAFIGSDGHLYTIRPDDSDRHNLTGQSVEQADAASSSQGTRTTLHTWPTWSPQGKHLAVSRVIREGPGKASLEVYSIDTATLEARRLFQNGPDFIGLIAPEVPHYMYWSPDGKHLLLGVAGPGGLNLLLGSVEGSGRPDTIIIGSPVYMAWAPHGLSLLLHVGPDTFLSDIPPSIEPRELQPKSFAYRTPGWSPSGQRMAYLNWAPEGRNILYVADSKGENSQTIGDVGPHAAFLWSPAQERLAFIETHDTASAYYEGLKIVELPSRETRSLTIDPVIAFFWSPNGQRIAYVVYDPSVNLVSWKVLEIATGRARHLVDFVPSIDLVTLFNYFDQYALSNSLWSPDSRYLVFTGRLVRRGVETNGTEGKDRVYVLDVDEPTSTRELATGSMAFWSWN